MKTQEEVAAMQGVSRRMIQKIEARAIRKLRETIERHAKRQGVSVHAWLFGEPSDESLEVSRMRLEALRMMDDSGEG